MLLTVNHLRKSYLHTHALSPKHEHVIIEDVSFQIEKGQSVGLVGESGSGKTTLAHIISGIEMPDSGEVLLDGLPTNQRKQRISMVFQDYTTSINPTMNVMQVIAESLQINGYIPKQLLQAEVEKILERVGLSSKLMYRYIHELSGGQAQRVCIGRALATSPSLIILDEPISSLDIPTQVQILDLLEKLKYELGLSYLFITHNIQTVCYFCDQVLFLYQKKIIERCETEQLAYVQHPYAKSLLASAI